MDFVDLLREARQRAGLSLAALARRSGTSRTTLSSYEHGRKVPTAATLQRVLSAAGFSLALEPKTITFHEVPAYRGRTVTVPSRLPHNPGLDLVTLPLHVWWSSDKQDYDLRDLSDREAAYSAVMTTGTAKDILTLIDADMLLEIFDTMHLPPATREAWRPAVEASRALRTGTSQAAPCAGPAVRQGSAARTRCRT